MSLFLKFFCVIITMSITSTAFSEENRFLALVGKANERCFEPLRGESCEEERKYYLKQNVINQTEYDWAVKNNVYPTVNRHNRLSAACICGCFSFDTDILVYDNDSQEYFNSKVKDITSGDYVVALTADATLSKPNFQAQIITQTTHGPEATDLYVFELSNKSVLKLTKNHGVLLSDGKIVAAKDATIRDSFVSAKGEVISIKKITRETTTKDVYNFRNAGEHKNNSIIVAEGVLVGDLRWQNELSSELNQIQVRQ